jgi:hypothetical protein
VCFALCHIIFASYSPEETAPAFVTGRSNFVR